jgi:hypothetical protein
VRCLHIRAGGRGSLPLKSQIGNPKSEMCGPGDELNPKTEAALLWERESPDSQRLAMPRTVQNCPAPACPQPVAALESRAPDARPTSVFGMKLFPLRIGWERAPQAGGGVPPSPPRPRRGLG